jgi:hypothetical protein
MRRAFSCLAVVCFSLLSLTVSASAQSPDKTCPTITVDCPTVFLKSDDPFMVMASVSGADPKAELTYNWTINVGKIQSGQGTSKIEVDRSEAPWQTFTATVEIGGLDAACQKTASCSYISHAAPVSRRFDKYGDLVFADEKKRLDYFAEQLKNEPGAHGYILVYSKRGAPAGEAGARATRARDYLVSKLGIAAEQLATIDGGAHERLAVELWITPQGGRPPSPVNDQGDEVEGN